MSTYTGTGGTKTARTYNSKSLLATYQYQVLPPGTHARETDSQPAIVIVLYLVVLIFDEVDLGAERVHCGIYVVYKYAQE